jgi:transcription elongation GreA/GreB family factor
MSRAFVKESDDGAPTLPDRPISSNRNLVTEDGLAAIEAALSHSEAAHRAAIDKEERESALTALREVRYWMARRASAEIVRTPAEKHRVAFGLTVRLRKNDGSEQSFRIVGEDQADPSRGMVSYVSPLARAVMTHCVGETVQIAGQAALILDIQ